MPLIGVEAGAASAVACSASAILCAYVADRLGLTLAPLAILAASLAIAIGVYVRLRRETVAGGDGTAGAFLLIVTGTFAWLMWRARPDFLPTGTGSDLAHHLSLIAYIEQHRMLVHGPAAGPYLAEMIDYTPGAHLLAVMAGAWTRRDALHVVHAVVSLTAAVKSGLVFLIARRLMPDGVPRVPFAIAAAWLLWLPYVFFAGSFMEQSFLSQVVSELFAVAMWWTIVVWREQRSLHAMALFALFGTATFLTWPIWVGPLVLTLVVVVMSCTWRDTQVRTHADAAVGPYTTLAVALIPIAIVGTLYASARQVYGFQMVNAVGFALWPSPRTLGWPFIVLAAGGLIGIVRDRRARVAALLSAAIALQAAALVGTGLNSGATTPYLTLKMTYLAIYPLAVAAAVMLAGAWRAALPPAAAVRYAWLPLTIVALAAGRSLASAPPVRPVVTQPLLLAGEWARAHVLPACVDYLVADGNSGYWLHLAVLGNPRASGRALDNDTFDPRKAIVRWVLPGGLPYAITEDFDGLPRDIRTNVDVLARFGPAAVVQRRGPSACDSK